MHYFNAFKTEKLIWQNRDKVIKGLTAKKDLITFKVPVVEIYLEINIFLYFVFWENKLKAIKTDIHVSISNIML